MKAGFLLDVNILIAMAWPTHVAHQRVQDWLSHHAHEGWATCPITQTAFVRILSNPAFSPNALTPNDALGLLHANLAHRAHRFWQDEISLSEALKDLIPQLAGHQQVTDAYLLGLAIHKEGRLATLDRAILESLPEKGRAREFVELL